MNIREWAKGHWHKIVAHHLGEDFANTRKHRPCPRGEGTDRYRFRDKSGDGSFFCACSHGEADGIKLLMCALDMDFKQACQAVEDVIGPCPKDGAEREPRKATRAELLRHEVIKTDRSAYLAGRGLEVAPGLDWHKRVTWYDANGNPSGNYPAMLAPLMRGEEFLTYHVTYLEGGAKAPVDPPRKILPAAGPMDGAACPLYQPTETLGIAEGVETAIAAKMLFGVPTWAALNTALLAKFFPPKGVRQVVIFGDSDSNYAGHAAAYALAHRLAGKGYDVEPRFPDELGDFNDVLLSQRRVA